MPLVHYKAKTPGRCPHCADGFDHFQSGSQEDLTECPKCGRELEKGLAERVNSPRIAKPLSVSDAKKAGFTVMKRLGKGEYEKL